MGEFLSLPVLVGAVNLPAIVVTCVIGAIAGWLASQIMKGGSLASLAISWWVLLVL